MSMMTSASSASKNASNCAKKKKKRLAHKLFSKTQKEVQNLILAPAFDKVYKSKVMSKNEDNKSLLFRKYHGNPLDPDYVSLVDQYLQGVDPFRGLFDQEEVLNKEPGNTDRTAAGRLVLKDCLTQDSSKKYVVGIHLT
jgi:predicted outer membrane protein